MNLLPESVLDTIYVYEHHLRHWDVMRELLIHKINCVFNVQFDQVYTMKYRHPDGSLRPCITIDRIEVSAYQLLYRIRERKHPWNNGNHAMITNLTK